MSIVRIVRFLAIKNIENRAYFTIWINDCQNQSPLYKLHKDYPLLMTSTRNPRSFKMINHGLIEIRHDLVNTNNEKII